MLIFHYNALPVNHHFATGLILSPPATSATVTPPPGSRRAPFNACDQAWVCGFTAAMESEFADVVAPTDFSITEVEAFNEGALEGYRKLEFDQFDPSDPADWDCEERAREAEWQELIDRGCLRM